MEKTEVIDKQLEMLRRHQVELRDYKINESFSKKQVQDLEAECAAVAEGKDYYLALEIQYKDQVR
jgi:hypothetical protein